MADPDDLRAAVIQKIAALSGRDVGYAESWYASQPLEELGGGTAESYVLAGHGEGVLRYLRNLAAGATG